MSGAYMWVDGRNAVRVGKNTLPGILTGLSVDSELQVQQDKLEGVSETITSVGGYTTAKVTMDITLLGDDYERERQLSLINECFLKVGAGGAEDSGGYEWRVVNPHLNAHRIRKMIFQRLSSRYGEDDTTICTLDFKEIEPDAARTERVSAGPVEMPGLDTATDATTGKVISGRGATGPNPKPDTQGVPPTMRGFTAGQKYLRDIVNPPADFEKPEAKVDGQSVIMAVGSAPDGISRNKLEKVYPGKSGITLNNMLYKLISGGLLVSEGSGEAAIYKVNPKKLLPAVQGN